jgi:hypothetical protein
MAIRPVGWTIQFDVTPAPKGPRARNRIVVDKTVTNTEVFQCPQTA